MIELTETAIGKVNEILRYAGTQARRFAHFRCGRRLFWFQLFHGFRNNPGHPGQDL